MLMLDGQVDLPEATVWPDEFNPNMFYVLPLRPSIAVRDGRAAFQFIKYRDERENDDGTVGAAFFFADVELAIKDEQSIKNQLAQVLTARRGPGAPPVDANAFTFSRPQWTSGSVVVEVFDNNQTVVQTLKHAGAPSMYGSNVVALSGELTQRGAPIFEAAMQSGGLGGIKVNYSFTFNARIPPIKVWADWHSERFYEFTQTLDFEENFWTEDDVTENIEETFRNSESLKGPFTDPGTQANEKIRPILDRLFAAVQGQLTEMIKRNLLEAIPPESRDVSKWRDDDFENIKRHVVENRVADVHIETAENQVLEIPVHPQANMPSLTAMGFNWTEYALTVDVDDPFFRRMFVSLRVNAPFEDLGIFSVIVFVDYPPETAKHGVQSFTFTKADDVGKFVAFTDGGATDLKFRHFVNYKGEDRRYESEWEDFNGEDLTINVGKLGMWVVDVQPGDINFEQVKRTVVTLRHPQIAPGVPPAHVIEIEKETQEKIRDVLLAPAQKYAGSVKYFMADGREYVREIAPTDETTCIVNDPFSANKTVQIIAEADFTSRVNNIFVDLTYEDTANQYTQNKSAAINKNTDPFVPWTFPVIDEHAGVVKCRTITTFLNGESDIDSGEVVVTGSTFKVGPPRSENKISVNINPALVPWDKVKLVTLTLTYSDPANGINDVKSFSFKSDTPEALWEAFPEDQSRKSYTYKATFFMQDGTKKFVPPGQNDPPIETTEQILVLELPA